MRQSNFVHSSVWICRLLCHLFETVSVLLAGSFHSEFGTENIAKFGAVAVSSTCKQTEKMTSIHCPPGSSSNTHLVLMNSQENHLNGNETLSV